MTPARICYRITGTLLIVWLSACSMLPRSASKPVPTVAQMPVQPFDDAVQTATIELINTAQLPPGGQHELVIDPLIDDATGFQVAATRSMQSQIVQVLEANHPQFEIREFTQENIARGPLVLLGSLAGINSEGEVAPQPDSYRIWLVLADLKSGKIVGKATREPRWTESISRPRRFSRTVQPGRKTATSTPIWKPVAASWGTPSPRSILTGS